MSDKIWEDIYFTLKAKPWGPPLIVLLLMFIIAFLFWNSLPESSKERLLSSQTKEATPDSTSSRFQDESQVLPGVAQVQKSTSEQAADGEPLLRDKSAARTSVHDLDNPVISPVEETSTPRPRKNANSKCLERFRSPPDNLLIPPSLISNSETLCQGLCVKMGEKEILYVKEGGQHIGYSLSDRVWFNIQATSEKEIPFTALVYSSDLVKYPVGEYHLALCK
ncbi:hypothetical protein Thimo_0398 [Thioflavicoccus mobilis 8321]|uniref:Uncharacterized protein n=1 Tax=Thioflavicoccus mobilis 8321 TaxID=765912 RepID=L0GTC5_9GAMM|nr:hypothetical protein [Thioflavicoccus mobilis]AGA89261.1 hypothetical protein Thimo_0398 [Thioflavicoccus mobilis 8321]